MTVMNRAKGLKASEGLDYARPAERGRTRVDGKFLARGGRRLRIRGVTYGPFAPDASGQQFPARRRVADDFARMRAIGVNAVRTYHVPPEWLLEVAEEQGILVFIDVPWPKHLCFLESAEAQRDARRAVEAAATLGRGRDSVLAYSIGNEIPTDVIRWHGARSVERFLRELADVSKQVDPEGLVTYAQFPPTEYLDLSSLDFATFNVYLHDIRAFRNYLFRLQNLVGPRPLVLGEIGMDTLRHGEQEQAEFLSGHVREATLLGLAGSFVFSWTDDWHTGGHPITDWEFGITRRDRSPKASYHALREVFESSPAELVAEAPRVSVVVCSYNGGRTLDQCLASLQVLDYPDYEVILVDDGSTDDTREIAARHPSVRAIHQENRGLSVARNVGLQAATGQVVAYTDGDCYADPDWLTHLVDQLRRSGAAAVGGPNLTPADGWLAGCVGASPGQPTHVLEDDQTAEHIPGCNMAYRREALEAINGFDPQYRKAGDDVDVCWRLQHAGYWITFSPGAFVWHHRRQNPRTYLRQQAGYGEAEALLRFKHPDKFNGWGNGKWRGVLYGEGLQGLRLGGPIIYRGVFGTGLFQCLYQPGPAHWAMLPSTLEWHAAAACILATTLLWPQTWALSLAMIALSALVAALQAAQARLEPEHDGPAARLLVGALCYAQPLVRSWARYRTRLTTKRTSPAGGLGDGAPSARPSWLGTAVEAYWSEHGLDRTELLGRTLRLLEGRGWGKALDSGWSDWDLSIDCHPWTSLAICTVQEEHGGGRHLIRVRYRLTPDRPALLALAVGSLAAAAAAWSAPMVGYTALGIVAAAAAGVWWSARRRVGSVIDLVSDVAAQARLIPCPATPAREKAPARAARPLPAVEPT